MYVEIDIGTSGWALGALGAISKAGIYLQMKAGHGAEGLFSIFLLREVDYL